MILDIEQGVENLDGCDLSLTVLPSTSRNPWAPTLTWYIPEDYE